MYVRIGGIELQYICFLAVMLLARKELSLLGNNTVHWLDSFALLLSGTTNFLKGSGGADVCFFQGQHEKGLGVSFLVFKQAAE